MEEELESWMASYDAELERRENKIIQLKYEKDQQEEEAKRLTQLVSEKADAAFSFLRFSLKIFENLIRIIN